MKIQQKKSTAPARTTFQKLESWLGKNSAVLLFVILGIAAVFSLLLFNTRIVENDDALYIEGGYNYAKNFFGYYYTVNAPLYIMFLSLPIALFGVKLIPLKLFSTAFFLAGIFFFHKGFKGRIPNILLFPVLLLMATNSSFLAFASLTFTEAFYMMMQALFFLVFFALLDALDSDTPRRVWPQWMLTGFMLFILSQTRNVAAAGVGAVILFFIFRREYLNSVYTFVSFAGFAAAFGLLKKLLWGAVASSQFAVQGGIMFQKDAYDPSHGKETLSGFVDRFVTNTEIYFSKRFLEILGLRSETSELSIFLTLVVLFFIGYGAYRIMKEQQQFLLASTLYFVVLCGATFISLHTSWGQPRFILIHVPFIFLAIFFGIYTFCSTEQRKSFQPLYIIGVGVVVLVGFVATLSKSSDNLPIVERNLKGDIYYGYQPEWESYVRMSRWCAENLPANSFVACRKPPVSFVYGEGKTFHGIYNVPSNDADTLLARLRTAGATHVMLDQIAGTVYRYVSIIEQKHPGTFTPLHQEGNGQTATYLFQINF